MNRAVQFPTQEEAIEAAKILAKTGPRVASVVILPKKTDNKHAALPGYMDNDTDNIKTVRLVTPDGRVWEAKESD